MTGGDTTRQPLTLGVDTGGTFTDAVLFDPATRAVVATSKAPTTHGALDVGIGAAIDAVLASPLAAGRPLSLVSLSTTLATNALVENRGRAVGAVLIGFDDDVVQRPDLVAALGGQRAVRIAGGHDAHGGERSALDVSALRTAIADLGQRVHGVAVIGEFSVRNPSHELHAAEVIRQVTGLPVTLSHHLSARLDGPRRAVTAVLNAQLVPIIADLIDTVTDFLAARSIDVPITVVRGDGSLVSASFVRERPIETILSGPAASVVGAAALLERAAAEHADVRRRPTAVADAIISDIGGTTTDVAVLADGFPRVAEEGATVGGHRTMVRAIDLQTTGLGGDSWIRSDPRAAGLQVLVGPQRVVPIGRLAVVHPGVLQVLRRQMVDTLPSERAGVFVVARPVSRAVELTPAQRELLDRIGDWAAADDVASTAVSRAAVTALERLGLVDRAALTPTDACAVLDRLDPAVGPFDREAAALAAELAARQRDRRGVAVAADGQAFAAEVFDTVVRRSADVVLAAAFAHDGLPAGALSSPLVERALTRTTGAVRFHLGLTRPIVALGASAATYYPAVGDLLGTEVVVPQHAGVANAVGAVAGMVRVQRSAVITSPAIDSYLVHGPAPETLADLDAARAKACAWALDAASADLAAAGGAQAETRVEWSDRTAHVDGRVVLVEATVTVTAVGRPSMAQPASR